VTFANTELYNGQDKKGVANTRMERFFDEDRFEIYATRKFLPGLCFDDALTSSAVTTHNLTALAIINNNRRH